MGEETTAATTWRSLGGTEEEKELGYIKEEEEPGNKEEEKQLGRRRGVARAQLLWLG